MGDISHCLAFKNCFIVYTHAPTHKHTQSITVLQEFQFGLWQDKGSPAHMGEYSSLKENNEGMQTSRIF